MLLLAVGSAAAQGDDAALEQKLKGRFEGQVLIVRGFPTASRLEYDAQGNPKKTYKEGAWTLYGGVYVDSVRLRPNRLEISGRRVGALYEKDKRRFTYVFRGDRLSLRVDLPLGASEEQMHTALAPVFLAGVKSLAEAAPPYWQRFLETYLDPKAEEPSKPLPADDVEKVGNDIRAPRPISTPDPHFPPLAKAAQMQGTTVLWLVVGKDGNPQCIRVTAPFGYGLDDAAVEAVQRWRFHPATKDGVPLPVLINVVVNFRLY